MSNSIDQANEGLRAHSRGGIAAVITVNSGAMIAVLTQLSSLRDMVTMFDIKQAFTCWIVGVVAGLFGWFFATWAASAHAHGRVRAEQVLTVLGYLVWLVSVGCFALGATWVLYALK